MACVQKSRWCKGGMQIFFSHHNAFLHRSISFVQKHPVEHQQPISLLTACVPCAQKSRWCKGGMQIFFSHHNAFLHYSISFMQKIV